MIQMRRRGRRPRRPVETIRHFIRYAGRPGGRPLRFIMFPPPKQCGISFVTRHWMQFYVTAVGEGLAPPAAETMRRIVRYSGLPSHLAFREPRRPLRFIMFPPPKRCGISFGKRRRETSPRPTPLRRLTYAYGQTLKISVFKGF